jgi:hypothetical protein
VGGESGTQHGAAPPSIYLKGNLALAFIAQSRADEAAAALHKAIDVIEVTWGAGGLNVVFTAARQLRRWPQLRLVRDVSDRLLALMAAQLADGHDKRQHEPGQAGDQRPHLGTARTRARR